MSKGSYGPLVKTSMLEELKKDLDAADQVFLTSFTNLDVNAVADLRKKLRESSTRYRVVKNTLIKRLLPDSEFKGLENSVGSQVGLGLSVGEVSNVSKVLVSFQTENETFEVKSMSFEGNLYSAKDVKHLAELPSRQELLSQVCRGLNSPITGLVTVLSGVIRNFVNVVDQIKTKKEESSN